MFSIITLYICIAVLKFFKNSIHFYTCKRLKQKFDYNYKTDSYHNYEILDSVKRHFQRTGTHSAIFSDQHYLANPSSLVYPHIISCFNHALGKYVSRRRSCFFWLPDILNSITFIPKKIKEKPLYSICATIFSLFLAYLFECVLDIWGIGNMFASHISAFLKEISFRFQAFFQWLQNQ